jgi:hypothetical protein
LTPAPIAATAPEARSSLQRPPAAGVHQLAQPRLEAGPAPWLQGVHVVDEQDVDPVDAEPRRLSSNERITPS